MTSPSPQANKARYTTRAETRTFTDRYGLTDTVERDTANDNRIVAGIALPHAGADLRRQVKFKGAVYSQTRLSYYNFGNPEELHGFRAVTFIRPGFHSALKHWKNGGPSKIIDVHSGLGELVVQRYGEIDLEKTPLTAASEDSEGRNGILPSGSFTGIRSIAGGLGILVTSTFYPPEEQHSLYFGESFGVLDSTVLADGVPVQIPANFAEEFANG